jgi:RNAse (barnase) inhibitor barstar
MADATEAVEAADEAQAAVVTLGTAVQDNTAKIQTLWDALFSDITTNPFTVSFADLSGVNMTAGIWNATLQRVEC